MNRQFPKMKNRGEDEEDFFTFFTSIGCSAQDAATTGGRNREADSAVDEFISKHKTERYRGRGHMLQEMEYKNVKLMDFRTAEELRSSGINMRDPDFATIKEAAQMAAELPVSINIEMMEPRFLRASPTSGQFEDAEPDGELPNPEKSPSIDQGFTIGRPEFFSTPDSVSRQVLEGIYPTYGARVIDQSAIDIYNYKFDESSCVKVDPASLDADSPTPPPCSSPLPDDQFLHDDIESKTDPKLREVVPLNSSTPLEQVAPDKPDEDLRDFILGFQDELLEHPEVLTCFLDVVTAWMTEKIAFREMEESLTEILSTSFPSLLERFIQLTKDIEFPQASANDSIKPRRKNRNLVVINFWKKEEEMQKNGSAHKDRYISIIKDCLSHLRETGVTNKPLPSDSQTEGAAGENDENFPPLSCRGGIFSMADVD